MHSFASVNHRNVRRTQGDLCFNNALFWDTGRKEVRLGLVIFMSNNTAHVLDFVVKRFCKKFVSM